MNGWKNYIGNSYEEFFHTMYGTQEWKDDEYIEDDTVWVLGDGEGWTDSDSEKTENAKAVYDNKTRKLTISNNGDVGNFYSWFNSSIRKTKYTSEFGSISSSGDLEIKFYWTSEESQNIELEDTDTSIKLETEKDVIPTGTELKVEEIKEEEEKEEYEEIKETLGKRVNQFVVYDMSLINNNETIQPNGMVIIFIVIPDGFDVTKLAIYRIEEDGSKVKYDAKIEGNMAILETDYISKYVLAETKDIAKGDFDADGEVSLYDAFTILRNAILENQDMSLEDIEIMDYDGDGKVTLYDAFMILREAILAG